MYNFVVNGGKKLRGSVNVSGSKNASLPILATALLNMYDWNLNALS